jgi:hypothetical protein
MFDRTENRRLHHNCHHSLAGAVLTDNIVKGDIMTRVLITCVSICLLAACSVPKRENPLPPIKSPDTAAQILLKNVFPGKEDIYELTFTLNDEPIYRFGDTRQFAFYLDTGNYMFGYNHDSEHCETNVYLAPNSKYVFELGPGCSIDMVSE